MSPALLSPYTNEYSLDDYVILGSLIFTFRTLFIGFRFIVVMANTDMIFFLWRLPKMILEAYIIVFSSFFFFEFLQLWVTRCGFLAVNHANCSVTLSSLNTSAEGKFLLFDYKLYSSFNQQMFIFCGIDLGY